MAFVVVDLTVGYDTDREAEVNSGWTVGRQLVVTRPLAQERSTGRSGGAGGRPSEEGDLQALPL